MEKFGVMLFYGVIGLGKMEVYLYVIYDVFELGGGVIFFVLEVVFML